jgi:hypothetical protein
VDYTGMEKNWSNSSGKSLSVKHDAEIRYLLETVFLRADGSPTTRKRFQRRRGSPHVERIDVDR